MTTETIREFLARGGQITKVPTPEEALDGSMSIRYETMTKKQTYYYAYCSSNDCNSRLTFAKDKNGNKVYKKESLKSPLGKLIGVYEHPNHPPKICPSCENFLYVETKREKQDEKTVPVTEES